MAVVNCNKYEDSPISTPGNRVLADNMAQSIAESGNRMLYQLFKNGEEVSWPDISISFRSSSPNVSNITLSWSDYDRLTIENIELNGRPYDVEFDHYSDNAISIISQKKHYVTARAKGWMKNENFAQRAEKTRMYAEVEFDCNIEIEITDAEGDVWMMGITHIY